MLKSIKKLIGDWNSEKACKFKIMSISANARTVSQEMQTTLISTLMDLNSNLLNVNSQQTLRKLLLLKLIPSKLELHKISRQI